MGDKGRTIDPKMLEVLVAPVSLAPLSYDAKAQELVSARDGLAFPIRDGIPILLVDEARPIGEDPVGGGPVGGGPVGGGPVGGGKPPGRKAPGPEDGTEEK